MEILEAINFAAEKHKGQVRKGSGLPYILHPIAVSHLILKYKVSKHITELQIAAILHDVLEDTECSYSEIEDKFGFLVASIVMELTSSNEQIALLGKNKYLMQKMVLMSKYAFILKLIDRLTNVSDQPAKKYLEDTIVMMKFVKENREDLSKTQLKIISKIETVCKTKLEKMNKEAK